MDSKSQLKKLVFAAAPFLLEAGRHRHSIVTIELDPATLLGLVEHPEDAGKILIVIASGAASIDLVRNAVEAAQATKN